jgi:two-component system sensor histidine kinase BarA
MYGEIGFDSTFGEGSTFWFTVPVSIVSQNSEGISEELAGKHIGLIDEHILCRRALKSMFEQWGCNVTEYSLDRCLTDPQFVDHDQIHIIVVGISRKYMQKLDQYSSYLGRLSEHAPVLTVVSTRSYTELGDISTSGFCNLTFRTARRQQIQQSMIDCLQNQTSSIITDNDEKPSSTEVPFNPSLRVLVVDDNDINLRLAEIILKKNNYDVTTICSGEESIELVRNNPYDLIFMDLHMPGLDGYETANRIRSLEDHEHRPVIIALTANAMPQELDRIESSGMDDVLIKPISEQLICNIISKWFSVPSVKVGHQTEPQTEDNIAEIFSIDDARKLANGNEELAMELFTMLIDELPEQRRGILQAREQNDLQMLREVTHKLNGASRCCGTPALRHAANSLENSINRGEKEDSVNEKTELLLTEIDRLLEMEMPASPRLSGES